jgi:hypothetical protein
MTAWHVDSDLARRYANGMADLVLAASVEAHVIACPACRETIAATVPAQRLTGIWDAVNAELDAPRRSRVERAMTRLGLRSGLARLTQAAGSAWQTRRPLTKLVPIGMALLLAVVTLSSTTRSAPIANHAEARPGASHGPAGSPGHPLGAGNLIGVTSEPGGAMTVAGKSLGIFILTAEMAKRLGIQTAAVRPERAAGRQRTIIPVAAVVGTGSDTWVYTNPEPSVFVRQKVTVDHVEGDFAVLTDGPPVGTMVATTGAATLYENELRYG